MFQKTEIDQQRKELQSLVKDITNPDQLRIIDKILLSRSTIEEKIAAIHGIIHESIDHSNKEHPEIIQTESPGSLSDQSGMFEENTNPQIPIKDTSLDSTSTEDPLDDIEYSSPSDLIRATFQQIYKHRKKLKPELTRGTFLQYVFNDLWRILIFARETNCIQGKLLYLYLQFPNEQAWEYIQHLQKKALPYLKDFLDQCEKKAWLFLEKQEFNGLMVIRELVTKLLEITQGSLELNQYKDHPIVKLEPTYLTLTYLSKEMLDFTAIIQKVFRTLPELPGTPVTTITTIEKILQNDPSKTNLGNFLLSLNMIEWYRYFILDELIGTPTGEVISSTEFDCSDQIQVEIRKYLKEIEFRISSLLKRRESLLPSQNQEDTDPETELSFFYSYGDDLLQKAHTLLDPKKRGLKSSEDQNQHFEKDKQLPLLFLLRFSSRWSHTVKPILNGTVPLTNGIKRIFHQDVFGVFFDKIETSLSVLGTYLKKYGTINQQQLIPSKDQQFFLERVEGTSEELKELVNLFDHCIFQYQQIFQVLSSVLKKHSGTQLTSNNVPINSRLISGEKLTIPHIQELVDQRDIFMGKSLGESLFMIQEMLLQFLNLIKPSAIEKDQSNIEDLNLEILSLQKMIRRIGSPEYYKRIREKYQLKM
jgi:hypothetical protein